WRGKLSRRRTLLVGEGDAVLAVRRGYTRRAVAWWGLVLACAAGFAGGLIVGTFVPSPNHPEARPQTTVTVGATVRSRSAAGSQGSGKKAARQAATFVLSVLCNYDPVCADHLRMRVLSENVWQLKLPSPWVGCADIDLTRFRRTGAGVIWKIPGVFR